MVTINRYIKALLHPAGGHQGSHKASQDPLNLLCNALFSVFQNWLFEIHAVRQYIVDTFVVWNKGPVIWNYRKTQYFPIFLHSMTEVFSVRSSWNGLGSFTSSIFFIILLSGVFCSNQRNSFCSWKFDKNSTERTRQPSIIFFSNSFIWHLFQIRDFL